MLTTPIERSKLIKAVEYRTKEDKRWDSDTWVSLMTKEKMLAEFHGWSGPVRNILNLIERPDLWALLDDLPAATNYRKGKIQYICLAIPHT